MVRDWPFASAVLVEVSPVTEACKECDGSPKWPCRPEGQQQIPASSLIYSTHRETLSISGSRKENVSLYLVLTLLLCISHGQQGFNLHLLTQRRWSTIDSHILFATDAGSSETPCGLSSHGEWQSAIPNGSILQKRAFESSILPHASHWLLHLEAMGYVDLIVRNKFKRGWP